VSPYVKPAVLAHAAKLNRSWVTKASQLGLVNTSALDGEDVIVVRVLAFVDQLVWPGERRSRSARRGMEPWQSLAVNSAREAARAPSTNLDSMMWIMPEGVELTHSPEAHSAFILEHRRLLFAGIPIGEWVAALPPNLETIFHWPRHLMSTVLNAPEGGALRLDVFAAIPEQVTAFIASRSEVNRASLALIAKVIHTEHPGQSIRMIQRPLSFGASSEGDWYELYEAPDGSPVRRPLGIPGLLAEFGPRLQDLGEPNED